MVKITLTRKSEAWGPEAFMWMGIRNYFTSAPERSERLGVTWAFMVFQISLEKDLERLKDEGWETRVLVMYLPGKHRSYAWPFPPAGKDRGTAASYPGAGEAGLSGSRWFAHQPVKLQVQWETLSHNISWGRVSEDHKNSDLGYPCACARVCVHTLAHTHMDTTVTKETNGRNEPSALERRTLDVD